MSTVAGCMRLASSSIKTGLDKERQAVCLDASSGKGGGLDRGRSEPSRGENRTLASSAMIILHHHSNFIMSHLHAHLLSHHDIHEHYKIPKDKDTSITIETRTIR